MMQTQCNTGSNLHVTIWSPAFSNPEQQPRTEAQPDGYFVVDAGFLTML